MPKKVGGEGVWVLLIGEANYVCGLSTSVRACGRLLVFDD